MTMRLILAIAAVAALASSGMAQDTTPSTDDASPPPQSAAPAPAPQAATKSKLRKVKEDDRMVGPWNRSVDQVEDMKV